MNVPKILITGFPDEVYPESELQLGLWAALGLTHYDLRFYNVGTGRKNVINLTVGETADLLRLHEKHQMQVACVATPIGKVPLAKMPDEVERVKVAVGLAKTFSCKTIRIFSGYPDKDADPHQHVDEVAVILKQMADLVAAEGIYLGLEVEMKLVGRSGLLQSLLHQAVAHEHLFLIHDGANLSAQGYTANEVVGMYRLTRRVTGVVHVKDFKMPPGWSRDDQPDENALKDFVPVGKGDSGYPECLELLAADLIAGVHEPEKRGLPGYPLALEPHLSKGGQFGGTTSPAAMGVALHTLAVLLNEKGLTYDVRETY